MTSPVQFTAVVLSIHCSMRRKLAPFRWWRPVGRHFMTPLLKHSASRPPFAQAFCISPLFFSPLLLLSVIFSSFPVPSASHSRVLGCCDDPNGSNTQPNTEGDGQDGAGGELGMAVHDNMDSSVPPIFRPSLQFSRSMRLVSKRFVFPVQTVR